MDIDNAQRLALASLASLVPVDCFPLKTAGSATLPPEYDWLLKNVCADASNTPVPADPYYGCPSGTTERDIQIGELLP